MSHDLYAYAAIALLTLCSVITRTAFLLFGDHMPLSERMRRALRYAPVAALAAVIVPNLLPWSHETGPVLDARLFAALIATLAYVRTHSVMMVIASGMLAFWILNWLF